MIGLLKGWYNSSGKQARILSAWKGISLTDWMTREIFASELEFFVRFTTQLMRYQKQLNKSYDTCQIIRDRLLSAVYIPDIRIALRDHIPRSSTQSINRIENWLSNIPGKSMANAVTVANWTENTAYSVSNMRNERRAWDERNDRGRQ